MLQGDLMEDILDGKEVFEDKKSYWIFHEQVRLLD